MHARPKCTRHYFNMLMDSARWNDFELRRDDIVICTPYKAGTTWMQMICALLIFQRAEFPRPLTDMSRWLDLRIVPIDVVNELYAQQTHRRIIKTHTPFDGIPYHENVTYLYCARDPREIFVSMWHHRQNQQIENMLAMIKQQGLEVANPPVFPADINSAFRQWLTQSSFAWETDGYPYWSVFSHAQTYWPYCDLPNVHAFHYADLKRDLCAEMGRIAQILAIDVGTANLGALAQHASFDAMKSQASAIAPNAAYGAWKSDAAFFHKGEHRQWEPLLSAENLELYRAVADAYADSELITWLEQGWSARSNRG